jgi:hypothetical protein
MLPLMTNTTMSITGITITNTTIVIAVGIVEAEQYCRRSRKELLHKLSRTAPETAQGCDRSWAGPLQKLRWTAVQYTS